MSVLCVLVQNVYVEMYAKASRTITHTSESEIGEESFIEIKIRRSESWWNGGRFGIKLK